MLVASGSARGEAGRRERLEVLQREARRRGLPPANIEVLTSESLTAWLAEHPAVAALLAGLPSGLRTLPAWKADRRHVGKWYPAGDAVQMMAKATQALAGHGGGPQHVHITGRPGVGKTRFALELCNQAPWRESVLYVPQPQDVSVAQILGAQTGGPARTLVLVVDEAPANKLAEWAVDAERCGPGVRLLTIGHSAAPSGTQTVEIPIPPLEPTAMRTAVAAWHPAMPSEHVEFVVEFADGYVRLARLAADAVAADPTINLRVLLQSPGVRQFISTLLPATEDRSALHVVAALSSVGWTGEIAVEGKTIAEHLGLNWTLVQARVHALDDAYGIAPRAGDLRYISPSPLGVYLAIDAWESYPDQMRSLRDKLPQGKAVGAYYDRLRAVMVSPRARDIAVEELDRFFSWERFKAEADVERWAALSLADAPRAAQLVRKALNNATHEQRLEIAGRARRALVDGLVELAWGEESFHDAALALAELADAENETWGNNATAEFVARFQVVLGGTASPYSRRLEVIDDLLSRGAVSYAKLAITALAQVGNDRETRSAPGPRQDAPRPADWFPRTVVERAESAKAALERLERIAAPAVPELADEIVAAARKVASLVRFGVVRDASMAFLRAAARAYPSKRESIASAVSDIVSRELRFRKPISEAEVEQLRALEAEFQDNTPEGRIRRAVAAPADLEKPDFDSLAEMILADPGLLVRLWPWLTSGEANQTWELGCALAARDQRRSLLDTLLSTPGRGRDTRFIAGYLSVVPQDAEPGWVDDVIDQLQSEQPGEVQLVADLTWRCTPSGRGAARVQRLAEAGSLEPFMFEQFAYGRWSDSLSLEIFLGLLTTAARSPRYREAAVALAHSRVASRPAEWDQVKAVVLELVSDPGLVRARGDMREYYWTELASKLAQEHPRRIARTLFAAQAARDDENTWFLEHSRALPVLHACATADGAGVWEELQAFLGNTKEAALFTAGFPEGFLDGLPHEPILRWVDARPDPRARLVADLAPKDLGDGSLGAELLTRYPEIVSGVFMAGWVSGAWWGEASNHWDTVAAQLEAIADKSSKPGVRRWAQKAAAQFRRKAEEDRSREAEERLRRR